MKYIYDENAKYIITTFDEISDEEIKEIYVNCIITNKRYIAPILKNGELVETYNEKMTVVFDDEKQIVEIKNGEYNLANSKVFDFDSEIIENQKYYYLNENLELVFNDKLKKEDDKKELERQKELEKQKLKELEKNLSQQTKLERLEQQLNDLTIALLGEGGEE